MEGPNGSTVQVCEDNFNFDLGTNQVNENQLFCDNFGDPNFCDGESDNKCQWNFEAQACMAKSENQEPSFCDNFGAEGVCNNESENKCEWNGEACMPKLAPFDVDQSKQFVIDSFKNCHNNLNPPQHIINYGVGLHAITRNNNFVESTLCNMNQGSGPNAFGGPGPNPYGGQNPFGGPTPFGGPNPFGGPKPFGGPGNPNFDKPTKSVSGSCEYQGGNYCGGMSEGLNANCFCDSVCSSAGDCCSDFDNVCSGVTEKVFNPEQQFYTQEDLQKYFSDLEEYRASLENEKEVLQEQQQILNDISKQVHSS